MKIISVIFLTLFIVGCSSTQSEKVSLKETQKPQVETTQQYTPAPPKNSFKPKVVQVDNYTSEYMYPSKKMQPTPVNQVDQEEQNTATETMTKEECIRHACTTVGIAFHSIKDYRHASDCFCTDHVHPGFTFWNEGIILEYVREAVVEKLRRDGYTVATVTDSNK